MKQGNVLVEALKEEDLLLRRLVARLPRSVRELPGPDGSLSCKETLGHIAYWDDFTVSFFEHRLNIAVCDLPPPLEFEARSRAALGRIRPLPFGEVLARYLESTGALIAFLQNHWTDLNDREQHDFWVPLKHRRHHRLSLTQGLGDIPDRGESEDDGSRLAMGA